MYLIVLAFKGLLGFTIVGGAVLTGILITIIIERQMKKH